MSANRLSFLTLSIFFTNYLSFSTFSNLFNELRTFDVRKNSSILFSIIKRKFDKLSNVPDVLDTSLFIDFLEGKFSHS